MSNRKVSFAEGEYYHIYNRGTNKMPIFLDKNDYSRFIQSLFVLNSDSGIKFSDISPGYTWTFDRGNTLTDIGAYCLMPNHFHLLVRAKNDTNVSVFMQKLMTSYSMYFNKKTAFAVMQAQTKLASYINRSVLRLKVLKTIVFVY